MKNLSAQTVNSTCNSNSDGVFPDNWAPVKSK
jgi:hypothetical protein